MMEIIPFDKIKKGDIATDYANQKWEVVDKGIGEEGYKSTLIKYDESGAMEDFFNSPEKYGYEREDLMVLKLVAVRDPSEYAVFIYGADGILVYKRITS